MDHTLQRPTDLTLASQTVPGRMCADTPPLPGESYGVDRNGASHGKFIFDSVSYYIIIHACNIEQHKRINYNHNETLTCL